MEKYMKILCTSELMNAVKSSYVFTIHSFLHYHTDRKTQHTTKLLLEYNFGCSVEITNTHY